MHPTSFQFYSKFTWTQADWQNCGQYNWELIAITKFRVNCNYKIHENQGCFETLNSNEVLILSIAQHTQLPKYDVFSLLYTRHSQLPKYCTRKSPYTLYLQLFQNFSITSFSPQTKRMFHCSWLIFLEVFLFSNCIFFFQISNKTQKKRKNHKTSFSAR